MTPEQRAAAIAMLGGGAAGNAGMQLGMGAQGMGQMPAPMPQMSMPPPMPPPMPMMSQAQFSGYPASPAGRQPLSPASAKKLADLLRGASRQP